ncbi:hypothetical protein G9A89_023650 [Geosiphon pyriformis]|nr:hypothetical protein G9A89_023650 [Geosiphon pyriformis]
MTDTTKLKINSGTGNPQNPNAQHYLSLLVIPKDALLNNQEPNQHKSLTSNIPPTTITNNKSLATIFPFEFEETTPVLLFSGAALDTKPITVMYTDVKVDSHAIKLILDIDCTASTCIITADRATKILISEIDNFPFEVNGIIILIKVLVIKATQYQTLTTQKLQLSQNTMCGYFKLTNMPALLIKFEEEEKKPTWEAYQVSWADTKHNKLSPIPLWDDNSKGKQREELTWNAN